MVACFGPQVAFRFCMLRLVWQGKRRHLQGEVSYLARTRVAHDSILKGNRLHMDNIKPSKPGDKAMSRPRHGIRG